MPLNFNVTTNLLSALSNNSRYIPASDSYSRSAQAESFLEPNSTAFPNRTIQAAKSLLGNFSSVEAANADFNQKMEFSPIAKHLREVRSKRTIEDNQDNVYNVSSLYNETTSSPAPYPLNPVPQAPIGRFSSDYILNTPFANIQTAPTLVNALITLAKHAECKTIPITLEGPLLIMSLERDYVRNPVLNSDTTPLLIVKPYDTSHQVQGIKNQGVIYFSQSKIVKIDTPNSGISCIKIKTPEEITTIVHSEKVIQHAQSAISTVDIRARWLRPTDDDNPPSYYITENQQKQFIVTLARPMALALHQAEEKTTSTENSTEEDGAAMFQNWLGVVTGLISLIIGVPGILCLAQYYRNKLTSTEVDIADTSDSENLELPAVEVQVLARLMQETSAVPEG